jgi:hypothetical protein
VRANQDTADATARRRSAGTREIRDPVQAGVRRLLTQQFDIPPGLSPGWGLPGVELVVLAESDRAADSCVQPQWSTQSLVLGLSVVRTGVGDSEAHP